MTATHVLETAVLLGCFVLLAGCYGVLYCLGRLRRSPALRRAAAAAYVLQGGIGGLLALTALDFWWKVLLLASFIAYLPIPALTRRLLDDLHSPGEQRS